MKRILIIFGLFSIVILLCSTAIAIPLTTSKIIINNYNKNDGFASHRGLIKEYYFTFYKNKMLSPIGALMGIIYFIIGLAFLTAAFSLALIGYIATIFGGMGVICLPIALITGILSFFSLTGGSILLFKNCPLLAFPIIVILSIITLSFILSQFI
jgi:hypothetical protein